MNNERMPKQIVTQNGKNEEKTKTKEKALLTRLQGVRNWYRMDGDRKDELDCIGSQGPQRTACLRSSSSSSL
jgi:hypothetical protein